MSRQLKTYLRTARKKVGLTQRELAEILGQQSSTRVSELELGRAIPSIEECVAFTMLFRRSFEELWPQLHFELQARVDANIRRLLERLGRERVRSELKRARRKMIVSILAIVVDGLPGDSTDETQ
jgi:transcriptional regulator with XRE-family HTH domain